jgi:hypothetical protein
MMLSLYAMTYLPTTCFPRLPVLVRLPVRSIRCALPEDDIPAVRWGRQLKSRNHNQDFCRCDHQSPVSNSIKSVERLYGWSRVRVRLGVELEREFYPAARGVSDEPLTRVSEVVER